MQLLFEARPIGMNSTQGTIDQEPAEWAPYSYGLMIKRLSRRTPNIVASANLVLRWPGIEVTNSTHTADSLCAIAMRT
jgi:hypothetical protein